MSVHRYPTCSPQRHLYPHHIPLIHHKCKRRTIPRHRAPLEQLFPIVSRNSLTFFFLRYWRNPSSSFQPPESFDMIHLRVYLAESDDKQDDKSDAAKTLYISCGGGGSSSSLSSITITVSANSDVVGCWIFMSYLFLPNDPLPSDDVVDWDNDSMLGIGGGDTNIDEGPFVLHNSW